MIAKFYFILLILLLQTKMYANHLLNPNTFARCNLIKAFRRIRMGKAFVVAEHLFHMQKLPGSNPQHIQVGLDIVESYFWAA